MDVDAITAVNEGDWKRLDDLASQRVLSGVEIDELVVLYRSASADLAELKSSLGQSPRASALSITLSRARLRLTRANDNPLRAIPRFWARQFPAALYRVRWTTLVVALSFVAMAAAVGVWIAGDPAALAALGPQAQLEHYADHEFVAYYSDNPAATFAGAVWTNNAWIAAQCVLFGITGIWPVYVLVQNAFGVGSAAGVMFAFDAGDVFVRYILPHGQLELTAVFVAAATGLHVFWAWVAPGAATRVEALAAAGRSLVTVAIGLVFVLFIAGLIEGFVTPWNGPWWIKIGIGSLALAGFVAYALVLGSRAVRSGETGDLTEEEAGARRLIAG